MAARLLTPLAALVLAGGLLLPAGEAVACSCAPAPMMLERIGDIPLVFEGRALGRSQGPMRVVTYFQVDRLWKGEAPGLLAVSTATSSAACGVEFQLGQSYRVVASADPDNGAGYTTNLCSQDAADLIVEKLKAEKGK